MPRVDTAPIATAAAAAASSFGALFHMRLFALCARAVNVEQSSRTMGMHISVTNPLSFFSAALVAQRALSLAFLTHVEG